MGERWRCPKCDKTSSSEGNLRIHMSSVHAEEKISCPLPDCDAQFSRKSSLTDHIEGIHRKINLQCNFCDRTYKWKHDPRKHIRIRHTEAGLHENIEKNVKIALFILKKLQERGKSQSNIQSIDTELKDTIRGWKNYKSW